MTLPSADWGRIKGGTMEVSACVHVFEYICEHGDVHARVHDFWGKGRSGFDLNCRIWSPGSAVGLHLHKPLSLRLLEPPVGLTLPLSSLSIYSVLSQGQRGTAQISCRTHVVMCSASIETRRKWKWIFLENLSKDDVRLVPSIRPLLLCEHFELV